MSRPRKQVYRSHEVSDLARQLMYAPQPRREQAVRNAERLHDELEADKNYPFDFIVYRITDRRVPPSERVTLTGEALSPDLRLLIDQLSRSIQMQEDPNDPCETTLELAARLNVSAKTIGRWRASGLRWRWGVRGDGEKPTVLFTRSAVEVFRSDRPGRVEAAASFSRMDDVEKHALIKRARRLAEATEHAPQHILEHLAKRTGRSIEALRMLIADHDKANPRLAVFADRAGPLTHRQKHLIDQAYRQGVTVSALCDQYGKARSTIYRAIHEGRARRLAGLTIRAIDSPVFDRDDADEVLLRPIASEGGRRHLGRDVIAALPRVLQGIYDRPIQADDVVRSLIVRYNFLKHRAMRVQPAIVQSPAKASDLDRLDDILGRIDQARREVIGVMLPIVVSVVLRQQTSGDKQGLPALLTMLSLAHEVLFIEIERYDAAISHTFESVLTNRIQRCLAGPLAVSHTIDETSLIAQLEAVGFKLESMR